MSFPDPRPPDPLDQFSEGVGFFKRPSVIFQLTGDQRVHVLVVEVDEVGAMSVFVGAPCDLGEPICTLEKLRA